MPFKYLSLPLSLVKPKMEDFVPILKRVEQKMSGCSNLLSYAEMLGLVKSNFSSLPIFYISTLSLHVGIVEQLQVFETLLLEEIWC